MPSICRWAWLGVAGIMVQCDDAVLAIDPFFTRPPWWRLWLGRVAPDEALVARYLPRCDHVLVTHAHWDHLMDVPAIVRRSGAVAYGSPHSCQLLAACRVPADRRREIAAGDRLTLGHWSVEVLPAEHPLVPGFGPGRLPTALRPPLRLRDYVMDHCFSLAITGDGLRLLDWRSRHVEGAPRAEILFVGVGEREEHYAALLRAVRPKLVVPIHWDDLFRPLSKPLRPFFKPPRRGIPPIARIDLAEFAATVQKVAPNSRVLIPRPFHRYDARRLSA